MKRSILFSIFFIAFLIYSCNNELDINDNWKDYTIVYGLINPNDTIQIIRVSKSFLGEGNAYQMAQNIDSIYYNKPLTVKLEEWNNGILTRTINLKKDSTISRDSGIFAYNKNYYFVTKENINKNVVYKLIINIDGKIVSSETKTLNDFPFITIPPMISFSYTSNFKFSFQSPENAKMFDIYYRFFYYEITTTDTFKKVLEVPVTKYITNSINGGEIINIEFPGVKFYGDLANRIPQTPNLVKRVVAKNAFQIVIHAGTNEMYAYMQVSAPSTNLSMDKPSYSNISNGIGLFTSRFTKYDNIRELTQRTIDSIAMGQYTKHLKFLNYSNSTIAWNYLP